MSYAVEGLPSTRRGCTAHAMPWRDSHLRVMVAPCATPWQESPARYLAPVASLAEVIGEV